MKIFSYNAKRTGTKLLNSYGKLLKALYHSQINASKNLTIFFNKIRKLIKVADWSIRANKEINLSNIEILVDASTKYDEAFQRFNEEVEKIKFETNEKLKQLNKKAVEDLKKHL